MGYACVLAGTDHIKPDPCIWFKPKWQEKREAKILGHVGIDVVSHFHLFSKDRQRSDKFILGLWLMLWLVRHWLQLSFNSMQFSSTSASSAYRTVHFLRGKENKQALNLLIFLSLCIIYGLLGLWSTFCVHKCTKYMIRESDKSHWLCHPLKPSIHTQFFFASIKLSLIGFDKESTILAPQRVSVSKHTQKVKRISAVRVWFTTQMSRKPPLLKHPSH